MHERDAIGGVVSCSALKRAYRDAIRSAASRAQFLHLDGDPEVIRDRIANRKDHFMPPSLLDSQLETLEPLEPGEPGVAIELAMRPDEIVDEFLSVMARLR